MAQTLVKRAPAFADTPGGSLRAWRLPAFLAALLLWATWTSGIDLRLLFSGQTWTALFDFLQRLFPPDLSISFLGTSLRATWMTFATAVIATAASSLLALPLGVLASGRLWRAGINTGSNRHAHSWMTPASWLVLHGMGVVRSIPDLVWALLVRCWHRAGSHGRNAGSRHFLHRTFRARICGCLRRDRCTTYRGIRGSWGDPPPGLSLRHSSAKPGASHVLHALLIRVQRSLGGSSRLCRRRRIRLRDQFVHAPL